MMPRTYNEGNIKCPFYMSMVRKNISCEGITADCITNLLFNTVEKRDLHRKIFCENRYMNCEIYTMLEKKYEE